MPLDHFGARIANLRHGQQWKAGVYEICDRTVAQRICRGANWQLRLNHRRRNRPLPRFLIPWLTVGAPQQWRVKQFALRLRRKQLRGSTRDKDAARFPAFILANGQFRRPTIKVRDCQAGDCTRSQRKQAEGSDERSASTSIFSNNARR